MSVRVQFVGSGDAFGSGGRLQTTLSLRWSGAHVLVDCGATALVGMKRLALDPSSVDAVVASHLHGDHFGGLPFLVLDQQFAHRERPLIVAGPVGLRKRVTAAMEVLFPGSSTTQRKFELQFVELQPEELTRVGPAFVTANAVNHASGAPSLALRVACADRVVAYSGDTAWTDSLLAAAVGADLFVCEALTFNKPIKYHLDYVTLRANRSRLGCRRLIVTHLGPDALAHLEDMEVEAAEDGLSIEI